jgi:hypothetical protein
MIFFESSAKHNHNVECAFSELGLQAINRQMEFNTDGGASTGGIGNGANMSMVNTNKM